MVDDKEWHKIGDKLCEYFGVCPCQRKLKSIINMLYRLFLKLEQTQETRKFDFSPEELLIISILDAKKLGIYHGTNIEYPIFIKTDPFW